MKLYNSILVLTLLLSFQTNTMNRANRLLRLNKIYRNSLRLSLNQSVSNPLRLNTTRVPLNYFSSSCFTHNIECQCCYCKGERKKAEEENNSAKRVIIGAIICTSAAILLPGSNE